MKHLLAVLAGCALLTNQWVRAEDAAPAATATNSLFRKVILDEDQLVNGQVEDTLTDPMELAVADDGRVFYAERGGTVKMWSPKTKAVTVIGKISVFTGLEDGLLGMTLDPKFLKNGWIYFYHSLPETGADADGKKTGTNRLSRLTLNGGSLDMASEKPLLDVGTQREQCCHAGGSVSFDAKGNLYVSAGDNTNPFESDGYAPIDERPGRSPWDAQKSSANANDLRGKILRIHPENDGTYTIPKGNLFKPGTAGTRPEIYVMGDRNPFRISLDRKNGFLYWGEVGPDAGGFNEVRGPAGFDEINQARTAGNFGWPYFVGDNKPYWHWDFVAKTNTFKYDPAKPVNTSPFNTGIHELPPAQPAFIYYPSGASTKFPVVKTGGRTAMAGPVYYFSKKLKSSNRLPESFDHTLFIYEWSRNWIIAVHLDKDEKILKMEPFCAEMDFKRPMDMELGPDGCLYIIEWGTAWGNNKDTKIIRLEYIGGEK
ncbi:MAG: PQQ-dependent sugar dehydrogenase [Verrucomicrobiota bacterium]